MINVEELTEEQLLVLERKMEQEIDRRQLPDFDLSTLTDEQLKELRMRISRQRAKGIVLDFNRKKITPDTWPQFMNALKEKEKSLMEKNRPLRIRRNDALPLMRRMVEECPKLELLNAAINHINYEEFQKVFSGVPENLVKKVRYNVY